MEDRVQQARDLLIQQYKNSPNLGGFIDAHTVQLQYVEEETDALMNERSLDTAVGVNLDIIGRIVVMDRPYSDPDPEDIFTFDNPSSIGKGYTDVDKSQIGGWWIGLDPIDNQLYNDELYRFILRAKIIYNNTKATLEDMYNYSQFVFGVEGVILERVGAVDVNIARPIGKQERQIIEATFPLAAGIRLGDLSYSYEEGAFGFTGNDLNGGFGDATDSDVGGVFSTLIID